MEEEGEGLEEGGEQGGGEGGAVAVMGFSLGGGGDGMEWNGGSEGGAYWVWRWRRQRPVRGRKKASATILASALELGFGRFFSTAMRDEKVRILSVLGPESRSAADAAIGWIMSLSTDFEMRVSADEDEDGGSATEAPKALSSFSGSLCDGNEVSGRASAPSRAASSFWNPASSRAPRLMAVRMEARWPME